MPIVGEVNYVNAKVPLKPKIVEELKKSEKSLFNINGKYSDYIYFSLLC